MTTIRNKATGQTFEIAKGALYPEEFYEEVDNKGFMVGESKTEREITQDVNEKVEKVDKTVEDVKKSNTVKKVKKTAKRSKKNEAKKDK